MFVKVEVVAFVAAAVVIVVAVAAVVIVVAVADVIVLAKDVSGARYQKKSFVKLST